MRGVSVGIGSDGVYEAWLWGGRCSRLGVVGLELQEGMGVLRTLSGRRVGVVAGVSAGGGGENRTGNLPTSLGGDEAW